MAVPSEAGEIGRARGHHPGVAAVGATEAEIHQLLARRRQHDARRLARDQRLEMQDVDQTGLNDLRFGAGER